jgi:hypothetical protein
MLQDLGIFDAQGLKKRCPVDRMDTRLQGRCFSFKNRLSRRQELIRNHHFTLKFVSTWPMSYLNRVNKQRSDVMTIYQVMNEQNEIYSEYIDLNKALHSAQDLTLWDHHHYYHVNQLEVGELENAYFN